MKKTITLSIATLITLGLMSFGVVSSTGITGKTTTGCTCHSAASNSAVLVSLTSPTSNLFTNGYVAGATYILELTVQETGKVRFGLDVKASTGTLAAGSGGDTKKLNTEITHTGSGNTGTNSHTFSFSWTAPASGAVTFNFAGNATNGNGQADAGDHWNKGSAIVNVASGVGMTESVSSNIQLSVFPNPVLESAKVSYELAENSIVSANLITLTGQSVASLCNKEEQKAGLNEIAFIIDPSIAKGIYFIAINVNGENSYRKILVH